MTEECFRRRPFITANADANFESYCAGTEMVAAEEDGTSKTPHSLCLLVCLECEILGLVNVTEIASAKPLLFALTNLYNVKFAVPAGMSLSCCDQSMLCDLMHTWRQ